ncbi:MAG: hypothetical protein ABSG33_03675 [Candidatus Bathyarchaeia archaeon]
MTTSIVECPHCHYRFNYEFIPSVSFYSIRLGTQRILKCPQCRDLHRFNVTHIGTDPSLPTHGDNSETGIGGRIMVLLFAPFVAFAAIGCFLLFTYGYIVAFTILLAIGVAWLFSYVAYLFLKTSQNMNSKPKEAT